MEAGLVQAVAEEALCRLSGRRHRELISQLPELANSRGRRFADSSCYD